MTALDGLVVLDATRLLPGAVATMWLANFGATVIKIEQPGVGDYARSLLTPEGQTSPLFEATNRGKQSMELDLKDPSGRESFVRLARSADVVVESFRPGVMDRLGLGYSALSAENPRLIYCAITGYGQAGPYRDMAGHDLNYIAMAGLLDLTGSEGGPPAIPGAQVADLAGGAMQAVIGILLALQARHRTGAGQMVDAGMMDGVAALLPVPLAEFGATGREPERGAELLTGRYACYRVYAASDGRYLAVGALEPKFWANLCHAVARPDLIAIQYDEPKQPWLKSELTSRFASDTLAKWWDRLRAIECCVTPVRNVAEVISDPHFRERPPGLAPVLGATPARFGGPAPRLGEHNPPPSTRDLEAPGERG